MGLTGGGEVSAYCSKCSQSPITDGSDGCFDILWVFWEFSSVLCTRKNFPKELISTVRSVRESGRFLLGCSVVLVIGFVILEDFGVTVAPLVFVIPFDIVPGQQSVGCNHVVLHLPLDT